MVSPGGIKFPVLSVDTFPPLDVADPPMFEIWVIVELAKIVFWYVTDATDPELLMLDPFPGDAEFAAKVQLRMDKVVEGMLPPVRPI